MTTIQPRLEILPAAQRRLWAELGAQLPSYFVLDGVERRPRAVGPGLTHGLKNVQSGSAIVQAWRPAPGGARNRT